eukprot:EG_transcript_4007
MAWRASGPITGTSKDHKVTTSTRVTTKKWPPDDFFQTYESSRTERIQHQQDVEALRLDALRKQEALAAFDARPRAQQSVQRPAPAAYASVLGREDTEEEPRKLTTKVVVKKWPPDSWFEQARKKQAPKPTPPVEAASPTLGLHQAAQNISSPRPPYPVSQSYVGQGQSPAVHHQPIPLDSNTRMYNPHGFWPYSQGQPKVQPAPPVMRRLREELPYIEGASAEGTPSRQGFPVRQEQFQPYLAQPYTLPQESPYPGLTRQADAAPHTLHPHTHDHAHNHAHPHEHNHNHAHTHSPPPQASPYIPPQEELYELGEHFQCLGCGCHIKPSEVVYRPRTVPCLPPAVEHCPVAIEKPGRPPVTVIPSPPKPVMRAPVQPRRPSPPPPPEPPAEELHIKEVEPFDFDKARREAEEKARKQKEEEEGEYRIKTVENFDFEAARRAGQEAAEREAREKAEEEARAAQPAPEPERVKIVEDFDFEAARQQAAQQQPQEETVPHAAKVVEAFDFEAARQPAHQPEPPKSGGFDFEAARAKVQAAAAARYVPQEETAAPKKFNAAVDAVIALQRMTTKKLVIRGPQNAPPRTIDASTDEENAYCVICCSEPKSTVILPCRHLAMCVGCAGQVKECPLCRTGVQQCIEVFI